MNVVTTNRIAKGKGLSGKKARARKRDIAEKQLRARQNRKHK
jgi:hypothetical protein